MNEEERHKKFKDQTGELYRAYGEFALKFEHVCYAVHTALVFMLHMEGLKNQQVANVLLVGLTADPLRSMFAALVAETQKLDNQEKKIIDSVLKRFQALTEKRNDVIHGTWFIGWANPSDTDFSVASGLKHHRSNKGASVKSFNFGVEEFQALTQEAEALAAIFQRLRGCFVGGFSVSGNFKVADGGHVSVP
jgi:hypothetical protein